MYTNAQKQKYTYTKYASTKIHRYKNKKKMTCPPGRQRAQCQASLQVEPKSPKLSGLPAPNPGRQCNHHHHHPYHEQLHHHYQSQVVTNIKISISIGPALGAAQNQSQIFVPNIFLHLLCLLLVARGHCIAGSVGRSHGVGLARRQQQQHQQHRCLFHVSRHLGGQPGRRGINNMCFKHGP